MTLKVRMQRQALEYYQVCSNDDPGLTLIYFTARSILVPYAFVWEKVKTMDFSETIVVYDVKVGRCSQLNEYMKLYEYQRSKSLIDLGPDLSDSIFLNFYSSITTWLLEAKFHVLTGTLSLNTNKTKPPWDRGTKSCSNGQGHMTKMATMPIYGKNHWKYFSLDLKGRWPWNLIHSIEYYQVCSNGAPGLTLTYFTARSNLVLYAFVWEKVKTMDFSETTGIVVYDIKVGRCSQLNESFMSTKGQGHSLTLVQITQIQLLFLNNHWF